MKKRSLADFLMWCFPELNILPMSIGFVIGGASPFFMLGHPNPVGIGFMILGTTLICLACLSRFLLKKFIIG